MSVGVKTWRHAAHDDPLDVRPKISQGETGWSVVIPDLNRNHDFM